MTVQAVLWTGVGVAAATTVFAAIADRRRNRRRDLDRPGWVPWSLVHVIALFATMVLAAIAATGSFDLGSGYHAIPRRVAFP